MKGIILGDVIINPEQITLIIKKGSEFTIHFADRNKIPVTDPNGNIWNYFLANCEVIPGADKISSHLSPE